jgi:aminopeptidase-like protein
MRPGLVHCTGNRGLKISEKQPGTAMMEFIEKLFPICRSITGDGVRETMRIMKEVVPLEITEVPSGTRVFDWTVPKEWNIQGAYLEAPNGDRIVDFADNNLHVVNYSAPTDVSIDLEDLQEHLHSDPEQPDLVPYRTSYYSEDWGFCLSHSLRQSLIDGRYRALINSDLSDGALTLGELYIPGKSTDEVIIYSHSCHPSLANNNLSGLAVTTWWARQLMDKSDNRYSYRFVWGPGTIGSITWLARNKDRLCRIKHGLAAVLLGRPGPFHYKTTRSGGAVIDKISEIALREFPGDSQIRTFDPYGYDERQFGSPGIDLPVGRLSRVPNGEYAEYHTSADNPELLSSDTLEESLACCLRISSYIELNRTFENLAPFGEPQLGRRGLYRNMGGGDPKDRERAILWLLNQSDGTNSVLDVAERASLSIELVAKVADDLVAAGLLREVDT